MPRVRKQLPAHLGAGELHYRGFTGAVDYEIQGDPSSPAAEKSAIVGALALYLDFINLFLYLIRILGKRK